MPLSPLAIGHEAYIPAFPLDINFDKAMNTGVTPANASFEVVIDGTPETPFVGAWQDSDTLRFTFAGVPSVSGYWKYISRDVNLHGTDGSVAKAPQVVQFYP